MADKSLLIFVLFTLGAALVAGSIFQLIDSIHRVVLEMEGKCDFGPCISGRTYFMPGLFALLGILGIVIAAVSLRVRGKTRRFEPLGRDSS